VSVSHECEPQVKLENSVNARTAVFIRSLQPKQQPLSEVCKWKPHASSP
jgi:hypothetical protein